MRRRGSVILLTTAIANCTETILGRSIPNLFKVSFGDAVSPAEAENYWKHIVDIAIPFAPLHLSESLKRGIDQSEQTRTNIKQLVAMLRSTAKANKTILDAFASRVIVAI